MAIATDFETFQQAINRMHSIVIELQEANKDVLVGKRNFNCLSCGIKDNASQAAAPTINSTLPGTDGRLYRAGNREGTIELTTEASINATGSKRY